MIKNNHRRGSVGTISKVPLREHHNNTSTTQAPYQLKGEHHQVDAEEKWMNVDLKNRQICQIQQALQGTRLWRVTNLYLDRNCFQDFPQSILKQLVNLQKISLDHNALSRVNFPHMNRLKILSIGHNCLESLNLQHLEGLLKVDCSHNQLSFLTLPDSLAVVDASHNQLSNLYSLQNCLRVEEVSVSHNCLYDLKFNLRPTQDPQTAHFNHLRRLDCSYNAIEYLQGLQHIPNITHFNASGNKLSITRDCLKQILELKLVERLNLTQNPLEAAGFTPNDTQTMMVKRLPDLRTYNDQNINELAMEAIEYSEAEESQRSFVRQQPYRLFLESQSKPKQPTLEWNFTLGDCDPDEKQSEERGQQLQQLSQIDALQEQLNNELSSTHPHIPASSLVNAQPTANLQQTTKFPHLLLHQAEQIKVPFKKGDTAYRTPQCLHFKPFLKQLLQLSYIPCHRIHHGSPHVTSKRLDTDDQDHKILSEMFEERGGLIYVKKISKWTLMEGGQEIYPFHGNSFKQAQMGFLMRDLDQESFKEICKFSRLVTRKQKDIISEQPNVFACFHIVVRHTPLVPQVEYPCAYLVQTSRL